MGEDKVRKGMRAPKGKNFLLCYDKWKHPETQRFKNVELKPTTTIHAVISQPTNPNCVDFLCQTTQRKCLLDIGFYTINFFLFFFFLPPTTLARSWPQNSQTLTQREENKTKKKNKTQKSRADTWSLTFNCFFFLVNWPRPKKSKYIL